jgi:GntR family transcriptional regulator
VQKFIIYYCIDNYCMKGVLNENMESLALDNIDIIIDKDSFIPVYYQLAKWLEKKILEGHLKAGDKIPSETELSEKLNISRMTVRKAFELLVKKNLIYSERGRGTFVAKLNFSDAFFKITEFFFDTEEQGMTPETNLLEIKIIDTPFKVANKLKTSNKKVLYLSFLRMADNEPVVYERKYILFNENLIQKISEELLSSDIALFNISFSELIEQATAAVSLKTDITIKASLANTEEAKLLNEKVGAPVLLVEQIVYEVNGNSIALGVYIYRGNKYKFSSSYSY